MDISSSADSNTNFVGILSTASRNHSTWSKSKSRDPKKTSAPSNAASTASLSESISLSLNTTSSTSGQRLARLRAALRYSPTLNDSNPEMRTMRRAPLVDSPEPSSPPELRSASALAWAAAAAAATAPPPRFATASSVCAAIRSADTLSRWSFALKDASSISGNARETISPSSSSVATSTFILAKVSR